MEVVSDLMISEDKTHHPLQFLWGVKGPMVQQQQLRDIIIIKLTTNKYQVIYT